MALPTPAKYDAVAPFSKDVLDKNPECAGLSLVVDMYEKGYNTSTMGKRSHFKSKSCTRGIVIKSG